MWLCKKKTCHSTDMHTHTSRPVCANKQNFQWPVIWDRCKTHMKRLLALGCLLCRMTNVDSVSHVAVGRMDVTGKQTMVWQQQNAWYCLCLCVGAFSLHVWVGVNTPMLRLVFRHKTHKGSRNRLLLLFKRWLNLKFCTVKAWIVSAQCSDLKSSESSNSSFGSRP